MYKIYESLLPNQEQLKLIRSRQFRRLTTDYNTGTILRFATGDRRSLTLASYKLRQSLIEKEKMDRLLQSADKAPKLR